MMKMRRDRPQAPASHCRYRLAGHGLPKLHAPTRTELDRHERETARDDRADDRQNGSLQTGQSSGDGSEADFAEERIHVRTTLARYVLRGSGAGTPPRPEGKIQSRVSGAAIARQTPTPHPQQ